MIRLLAVCLMAFGWWDWDGMIAWQNVLHLGRTSLAVGTADRDPDVEYLRSLAANAIPALDWLRAQCRTTAVGQSSRQAVVALMAALIVQSNDWRNRTMRSQVLLHAYPRR